jgi:alkyl sulfatase BDS1-like metallo-beta-lactamase superfamily hydrolase
MKLRQSLATFCLVLLLVSCDNQSIDTDTDTLGHSPPSAATIKVNRAAAQELDFADNQDFEDATRGLIATEATLKITDKNGKTVWDQDSYEFISGDSPDSVNPSLWRQAKLNNIHGLFKVTEGIYQLRGYDLSNMTIIEGASGWIIVDPLTSSETAARAIRMAREHLGTKPVRAIIFTHSHVDHFAGVMGVFDESIVNKAGGDSPVQIIAPEGFMQEATSETVIAGIAMGRRAAYMYGFNLQRTDRGHIDSGLGKQPALGTLGILNPTRIINSTPQELIIDGVRFVFQNVPGSEAPAELTFYLPEKKAFCGAEIVSRNMHNVYTLRGAKVRDALKWSSYIDQSMRLFSNAELYFGSHHWPVWGNERVIDFLKSQRDTYKFIHDQTIRLASAGLTPSEIAEQIQLPESLRSRFSSRGYYGTAEHNAKAVYQYYFGWYDGNPVNLNPLPPEKSAGRYVSAMGGAEQVLDQATSAYDKAEYRWAAELLNHLVFAEPENVNARLLLARTYDQLGYQSESGPWRDNYLTAAYELRHGIPEQANPISGAISLLSHTPIANFLDAMATRIDGSKAENIFMVVNVTFSDLDVNYVLTLENAVLNHSESAPIESANVTIKLTKHIFLRLLVGQLGLAELFTSEDFSLEGSKLDLVQFLAMFEKAEGAFPIVTP